MAGQHICGRVEFTCPQVVRLLADPVRWRLLRELARGDLRVRELVATAGQPQNLVSYHLRQLRDAGLVTARRSSFDARDTYYSLDLPPAPGRWRPPRRTCTSPRPRRPAQR